MNPQNTKKKDPANKTGSPCKSLLPNYFSTAIVPLTEPLWSMLTM